MQFSVPCAALPTLAFRLPVRWGGPKKNKYQRKGYEINKSFPPGKVVAGGKPCAEQANRPSPRQKIKLACLVWPRLVNLAIALPIECVERNRKAEIRIWKHVEIGVE